MADIHQGLDLFYRTWTRPNGDFLDRDINASKNILKQGLRITLSGTCNYTDETQIRLQGRSTSL